MVAGGAPAEQGNRERSLVAAAGAAGGIGATESAVCAHALADTSLPMPLSSGDDGAIRRTTDVGCVGAGAKAQRVASLAFAASPKMSGVHRLSTMHHATGGRIGSKSTHGGAVRSWEGEKQMCGQRSRDALAMHAPA